MWLSGMMNRHCIPGLTMSSPDGELLREVWDTKTMHTGFSTRIALCQRPGADTEETGRYDLAWKDLCVLNAQ